VRQARRARRARRPENQFPHPEKDADKQTGNNNVNRRFAGRELKIAVAAADDETKESEEIICLTW
jgi:hypothetical protein